MAAVWMAAAMTAFLQGTNWVGPTDAPLKITFENGRAHGTLSCNSFRTLYEEDKVSLGFGGIITTRKGCAPDLMKQERLVLSFLEQTKSFALEGDQLVLKNAQGKVVLRLNRKV